MLEQHDVLGEEEAEEHVLAEDDVLEEIEVHDSDFGSGSDHDGFDTESNFEVGSNPTLGDDFIALDDGNEEEELHISDDFSEEDSNPHVDKALDMLCSLIPVNEADDTVLIGDVYKALLERCV